MVIGYDAGICIADMTQGYGIWICHRDVGEWVGQAQFVLRACARVRGRACARFYLGDERSI